MDKSTNQGDLRLQEGDVIFLNMGDRVYADVPWKFIFKDSDSVDRKFPMEVTLPTLFKRDEDQLFFDYGEYVVIKTAMEGGGDNFDGPYPDGHCVYCKKLKNGKYNPNGNIVKFYQSGCFTCMIKNITPTAKMEKPYVNTNR